MSKTKIIVAWIAAMIAGAILSVRLPIMRMSGAVQHIYFSEFLHISAHMFLFGVLVFWVTGLFWQRPAANLRAGLLNWRSMVILLFILCVGVLQEGAQLLARGLPSFRINEFFDLGVDFVGAWLGMLVFHIVHCTQKGHTTM